MQKYFDSVISSDGRPVAGASVTVRPVGGGSPSSLFSDSAGTVPKANPMVTDANGFFEFYAADGRYTIEITISGFGSRTVTDVLLEDPADANQQTINGGSINNTPIGAVTPSSGAFTTLSASGGITGNLTGNASTATTAETATTATTATNATNLSGGTVAATSVTSTGQIRSSSPSAGLGYATGAGGAVVQPTSKATTVTINTLSGRITTAADALGAGAITAFNVNNSSVTEFDSVILTKVSDAGDPHYSLWANVDNGVFAVYIRNISGGSRSEAIDINFAVIKGVIA